MIVAWVLTGVWLAYPGGPPIPERDMTRLVQQYPVCVEGAECPHTAAQRCFTAETEAKALARKYNMYVATTCNPIMLGE